MTTNPSLWNYVIDAGFVVKCVMLILFAASIASWSVIIERRKFYKKQWQNAKAFQARFWSGADLNNLYQEVNHADADSNSVGMEKVFVAGFQTFSKLKTMGNYSKELCAGPHVQNTKELGKFKITKEESSSSGVRRIKAVLE